jgi:hypothetical protein
MVISWNFGAPKQLPASVTQVVYICLLGLDISLALTHLFITKAALQDALRKVAFAHFKLMCLQITWRSLADADCFNRYRSLGAAADE